MVSRLSGFDLGGANAVGFYGDEAFFEERARGLFEEFFADAEFVVNFFGWGFVVEVPEAAS